MKTALNLLAGNTNNLEIKDDILTLSVISIIAIVFPKSASSFKAEISSH